MSQKSRITYALIALLLVVVTIIGSPVLLMAVAASTSDADWGELSAIGQSYGGVAAVISAVGLVALAYSVLLQVRQTRIQQLQSVREMQIQISSLPYSNPTLMHVLVPQGASEAIRERTWVHIYINMLMRYVEFAFLVGEVTAGGVTFLLRRETFVTDGGRRYWERSRPAWAAERPDDPQRASFMAIVDGAHRDACAEFE